MLKYVLLTLALSVLLCISTVSSYAAEHIKVLMLDSVDNPLPAENAVAVERLNGRVLFRGRSYSGSFELFKDDNGLHIINSVPFEEYIEGVVASESGRNWEPEALKAQAVIARSYALHHMDLKGERRYHLTSSVLHQAYGGDSDDALVRDAVSATEGEVLLYGGRPINAFYHSTCEGKTELPEEVWAESYPYLRSVECNGKDAPYENWKKRFTIESIGRLLGMERLKDISVASRTATGRAKTLRIVTGDGRETEIKATEFRRLAGYRELPSTDFSITHADPEVVFEGRGYGHGVGLSQWGALTMAHEGKDYREILAHYYPGASIARNVSLPVSGNRFQERSGIDILTTGK